MTHHALTDILRDADPETGRVAESWEEPRIDAFVARTVAMPDAVEPDGRRRARTRVAVAGAATLTATAVAVGLVPVGGNDPVAPPGPGSNESARSEPVRRGWSLVPNAAAAELDAYVIAATDVPAGELAEPGIPDGAYLYTKSRFRGLGGGTDQNGQRHHVWRTSAVERWMNSSGLGEQREISYPDTAAAEADPDADEVTTGSTHAVQLTGGQEGEFGTADPAFTRRVPTTVEKLHAFLLAERPGLARGKEQRIADTLVELIKSPWLNQEQRGAAIRLLGRVPGPWESTGPVTVHGVEGIGFTRKRREMREEYVLTTLAPGLLRFRTTLVDPAAFDGVGPDGTTWVTGAEYYGVPEGTVTTELVVTRAEIVDRVGARP